MNYTTIINELANLNPPTCDFTNQTILRAMAVLCNPQHSYKVIHIAGTNGKGSTAAFIATGLLQANYSVGKFTSPYIHRLNECILLNNHKISDADLVACYLDVKQKLEAVGIWLSAFEMLTAIMFVYFALQKIDYLVLETGLGGHDDATNVVNSCYSVITNISLEHTAWLGDSLASIAAHKAGIIHHGKTIIADNGVELLHAVRAKSKDYVNVLDKYSCKVKLDPATFTTELKFKLVGDTIATSKNVILGLFGYFQVNNFLIAYEVLRDIGIAEQDIFIAARNTHWHGRLQRISRYPLIIADASHNLAGCKSLYQSVAPYFCRNSTVIICSILQDKDIANMLTYYSKIATTIIFCPVKNPRASNPYQLAKFARGKFDNIYVANSVASALQIARKLKAMQTIVSGSTYLLHEVC